MDVNCTACGEPWDVYHLRHDLIWEVVKLLLSDPEWDRIDHLNGSDEPDDRDEAKALLRDKWQAGARLDQPVRDAFRSIGWEFGQSALDVRRCGCCPKGAEPDPDKAAVNQMLGEAMGDDLDGIVAMMEDVES